MVPHNSSMLHKVLIIFIVLFCYIVKPASSNTSSINNTKDILEQAIEGLVNEVEVFKVELQISNINKYYGSSKFFNRKLDPQKKLEELSNNLKNEIDKVYSALENAKDSFKKHIGTTVMPNNRDATIVICEDSSYEEELSSINKTSNYTLKYSISETLNNIFSDLWEVKSNLKDVYYLSLTDRALFYHSDADNKCYVDHSILWKTYMSHNSYRTRQIILLLDHGNSIDDSVLSLSKLLAKQMVSILNENDKFTVIATASKWSSLTVSESCGNEHLPSILYATDNNKELIYKFIDGLTSKSEVTDHNVGMRIAMKMARLFYAGDQIIMLLYISPGMEFSMSEAMNIVATSDLSSSLVINTCAVSSGTLPDVQDMNMLSNIMNDFFMEKNKSKNQFISRGPLVFINNKESIGPAVARFSEMYNRNVEHQTFKSTLPQWDSVTKDLFISLSIGFQLASQLTVFGVDLFFSTFFRDIMYFSFHQKDMYAILMDLKGNVLIHPSIPVDELKKQIKFAHITKYLGEKFPANIIFQKSKGSYFCEIERLQYLWQHIDRLYVIIMVVKENEELPKTPSKTIWLPDLANSQLVSYLLDLAGASSSCRFLDQIVNFEAPSLHLSPNCFQNIQTKGNESTTLKLLPYLQHDTLLLKHEGLQDGIRDELAGIIQISELLKKQHANSNLSDYIVRRYVATKSGLLHVFPGIEVSSNFEPSKRLWFIRAMELNGELAISSPYLDAGGAGYIITISYATSFAVVGIDVTYGFVSKIILENYIECSNENITCFLVDDRGYLISHPDLVTSLESDNEPIEQLHIVHKESSVANDILNHENFVRKLACNDYSSATVQRYYQMNMSFYDILNSTVQGEPCVSYRIGRLNMTNLFFGVVKAGCSITRTFCPCSVIDRLCLNCQHMEEQECECPCECPIYRSSCSNYTSHDDYKVCKSLFKISPKNHIFRFDSSKDIEQCYMPNCETRPDLISCLGVIGCEWCAKDTFGDSLDAPFCASMASCFNSVLGGPNPYKEGNTVTNQMFSSIKNTTLVLSLIVILGIVLILTLICWRSNNSSRNQNLYLSARQDEQLHMSDLNINDDFLEQGNHSDKLLLNEKKITPVSPYCVASNYSRPNTAADSDHGYSTMTPHEESEHLSLAPIEIDSLEDDLASDKITPPSKRKNLLTKFPQKNCIIVPVTVHKHVDAI